MNQVIASEQAEVERLDGVLAQRARARRQGSSRERAAAHLLDPFGEDSLPNLVQPALKLVDFSYCSSDYFMQELIVDGDVSVEGIVQGLKLFCLVEQVTRELSWEEGVRSVDCCSC